MKQFVYKAKDKSGMSVSGTTEGTTATAAARTIQEHGLLLIDLSEKRSLSLQFWKAGMGGVSERDVANFTRFLGIMLSAGLPLTDALANLRTQYASGYLKDVIRSLIDDVQAGAALSVAMGRFPAIFSPLYLNVVKAGELSGKVDEMLGRLADNLEAELGFKGKVRGAMIYPAIISTAMLAIGTFMVTTIIPKIAQVYKDFGAELPLPTKILMGVAGAIGNYWYVFILFIGFLVFTYRTLKKNNASEYFLNNLFFHLPIMGSLNEQLSLTVVCRTLGTLLGAGVGVVESLKVVGDIVGNNYFRTGLLTAARSVEKGLPLSLALRRDPNFPLMISQLMAIGEETGTLDQSLLRVAKFYQESTERKVQVLTTTLEPVMILVMGGMVGLLALSVLLPMFNLINVVKQ